MYITERRKQTHLLQWDELKATPVWQIPFHDFGTGPIPSSLKLFDSGQTPDRKTHQLHAIIILPTSTCNIDVIIHTCIHMIAKLQKRYHMSKQSYSAPIACM